jgi:hypothetical protein
VPFRGPNAYCRLKSPREAPRNLLRLPSRFSRTIRGVSVLSYFRSPFPSTQGFSAYRMPGMAVHGPLILASAFAGFLLCWPHAGLRPLTIIWVLAGLYLGRDIAVLCHYNGLLTLVSWGASALVFIKPASIARFGAAHIVVSALLSAALGTVLFLVAFATSREAGGDNVPRSGRR